MRAGLSSAGLSSACPARPARACSKVVHERNHARQQTQQVRGATVCLALRASSTFSHFPPLPRSRPPRQLKHELRSLRRALEAAAAAGKRSAAAAAEGSRSGGESEGEGSDGKAPSAAGRAALQHLLEERQKQEQVGRAGWMAGWSARTCRMHAASWVTSRLLLCTMHNPPHKRIPRLPLPRAPLRAPPAAQRLAGILNNALNAALVNVNVGGGCPVDVSDDAMDGYGERAVDRKCAAAESTRSECWNAGMLESGRERTWGCEVLECWSHPRPPSLF